MLNFSIAGNFFGEIRGGNPQFHVGYLSLHTKNVNPHNKIITKNFGYACKIVCQKLKNEYFCRPQIA